MKKCLNLAGFLAAAVLIFFIVVSLAFYHLMQTGELRRYLINEIQQNTNLIVRLGEADLEFGRILGVSFHDVEVAESDATPPVISAERVTARVALWPLLNRRLVFYEVRLRKPDARLARDKTGKIAALERLLNLPFLKQDGEQFTLDLRSVRIAEGTIEFTDHISETPPITTHLKQVALAIERVRGRALSEIVSKWVGTKGKQPQGAALKIDFAASVERLGQRAQWRAQGNVVFTGETLDLAQAWCDIETQISDMPAKMVQDHAGALPSVKSLGGVLDSQLRIEGHPTEQLNVSGKVDINGLSVDAPQLFVGPLDAGKGQLRLDIHWQPNQWKIAAMDYRSKDLSLGLEGLVRGVADGDKHLRLDLSAQPLSVAVLKKYFPAAWLASSPIDKLVNAVAEGEVQLHKAGVNATITEIRRTLDSGSDDRLWFDVEVRGVSATLPGQDLRVSSVNGRIVLDKGRFAFKSLRGNYGRSRLANVDGSYLYSPAGPGLLKLSARGEADLGELREQAQRGMLPEAVSKPLLSVQAVEGKSPFDITITRFADGSKRAEGKLALDNARMQWKGYALTNINGDLAFTPTEIKTEKMGARISGSPLEMRLTLKNYATDDGMFDLAVDSTGVKAGILSRLLLETGSIEDPGIVRGSVRYHGLFSDKKTRKFTGNLELVNVQMATQPLLQPLRQLNGKISIDESGIGFKDLTGLLVGLSASASGRWHFAQQPQLIFEFAAPDLDISYLISQIDPESTDFYENLQAEGRVDVGKGRIKNLEFIDAKSSLTVDRRVWHFPNLTLRTGGGTMHGPLTIVDKPGSLGIITEPKVQNVPLSSFLRWFDIATSEITGAVDITGKFDTKGKDDSERKRSLNGAFNLKIADGTIHRLRILVQLLNVLDVSRWFTLQLPDLGKQGIRFRAITGDFKVARGVYSTENLLVDSDDLRMTGAGKIDVPRDEIDFIVAVRPFAGVDTVVTKIPLLGQGIAAIKNSFLVASFNIKGRIDDPTITPAPLGTLTEMFWGLLGIPKSLIPSGGDVGEAQKEAPQGKPLAPIQ